MIFDEALKSLHYERAKSYDDYDNFLRREGEDIINEVIADYQLEDKNFITSNLYLHWKNDIQGKLKEYYQQLDSGEMFIATIFGNHTLQELREYFQIKEEKLTGGVSPRVIPMIDVKDAARLLQHAGFKEPISSNYRYQLEFSSVKSLAKELRMMGEQNALIKRNKTIPPRQLFESDKPIIVTFDIVLMLGIV